MPHLVATPFSTTHSTTSAPSYARSRRSLQRSPRLQPRHRSSTQPLPSLVQSWRHCRVTWQLRGVLARAPRHRLMHWRKWCVLVAVCAMSLSCLIPGLPSPSTARHGACQASGRNGRNASSMYRRSVYKQVCAVHSFIHTLASCHHSALSASK